MSDQADGDATSSPGEVRELRIALVCYGGVSLAIYMHGVTKEIHKLLIASAAFDRDQTSNPFRPGRSEHVYWEVLSRIRSDDVGSPCNGARTRVVVDIVSGTSAGGINGVFLAKAVAINRSLDALKALWMEKGDIGELLAGSSWLPPTVRVPVFVAGSLLRRLRVSPFLDGRRMSRWLLGALDDMDRSEQPVPGLESLMPVHHDLELAVPVTDFYGYSLEIPMDDPRSVREQTHRHVLRFRGRWPGRTQFGREHNHALAFAARATSSFPGFFPPVSIDSYTGYFDDDPRARASFGQLLPQLFPEYEQAGVDPEKSYFLDGGVLDNFPFDTTIDAIKARAAGTEVDRRLVYIEPDPGGHAVSKEKGPPNLLATAWGAYAQIPRKEPIVDDLRKLGERNLVVGRIRDIIEASFQTVAGRVAGIVDEALGPGGVDPTPEQLLEWRASADQSAGEEAGFSLATYIRLRIRFVVERYARAVGSIRGLTTDSREAAFIQSVFREWAHQSGLFDQQVQPSPAQVNFLRDVDLDYHERRIYFVIAAFSWLYRECGRGDFPTRAQLDAAKRCLYRYIDRLGVLRQEVSELSEVRELTAALFGDGPGWDHPVGHDARAFSQANSTQLGSLREMVGERFRSGLEALASDVYEDLRLTVQDWADKHKRDLLVRYLGFPFWDILVYPLQATSEVGERDHVEVVRMSPDDARLLEWPGEKLRGVSLHHFGAFFDRPGRENDYLWGRLDAAERLLTLLLQDPEKRAMSEAAQLEWRTRCREAFEAILSEERPDLTHIAPTMERLDRMVEQLAPGRKSAP